jgi:O-antigen/teichoic acid export membrane protein
LRHFADLKSLMRLSLRRSVLSLVIKVATAGLTYFTYIILSRMMSPVEYGYFAFGLSLATVLSIGASMGQQTAILRYWPEEMVTGRPDRALRALRNGGALVILAGIGLMLALGVTTVGVDLLDIGPSAHLYAGALLILPMGLAEYLSSALRAQGSVWTALAPRDIVWRVTVPILAVGIGLLGVTLFGWSALLLTALLLAVALALQVLSAKQRGYEILPSFAGLRAYWQEHGQATRWFLLGTVVDSAALNVDIILVGLFVAPESAGVYFNAFRTAGLLTLFMFAITLVAAPMVSQHFHAGEMRKAQAVTALCAWAGFLFSLVMFAAFAAFGDEILSLFGTSHEDGYLVLLLLSVGLLFDAATGPSRIVMMMTGHERDYVRIFGGIMIAGMVVQVAVIPAFGMVGAAAVNMGSRIVAQLAIAWWSRRRIGLDTSLLGLAMINRLTDQPRPAAA